MGFVKSNVFHSSKSTEGATSSLERSVIDEDDENWYKFDDDKVSVFPKDKLGTIDGGGK